MPGSTPVYGLPYLELDDAPDIAGATESLAEAVEVALSPVLAQLRQTSAQTINDGVWSALNFQAEDVDTHNGHDNSTNTSRYTCQVAGTYALDGAAAYTNFTSGSRWTRWAKNGVELAGSGNNADSVAGQQIITARTILVALAVGDYVQLQTVYFGANINTYVAVAYAQSTMTVRRVGP